MIAASEAAVANRPRRELIHIPKQSGRAFLVRRGDLLRVVDPEGQQVADLVTFGDPDRSTVFSAAQTREVARSLYVSTGDSLFARFGPPLLTIVADDVGRHDLLFPPCNPGMYRRIYGQENHPNCLENLSNALAPHGVAEAEVPMPFNIFQHTVVHPDGQFEVRTPLSRPGDAIVFGAELDLLVAVSACSVDGSPCNGFNPTPIVVEIYGQSDA